MTSENNSEQVWPPATVIPFPTPQQLEGFYMEDGEDVEWVDEADFHNYAPTYEKWDGPAPYPHTLVDDNYVPTGIQFPDGTIIKAAHSRVGTKEDIIDPVDGQVYECEVMWDGAKPDLKGHSKGLLIDEYETTGELWRRIALGGHGYFRKGDKPHLHHLGIDDSEQVPGDNNLRNAA